jgi:hypothetical protein
MTKPIVEILLKKIASSVLTQKELVATLQNAQRHEDISDEDRERLIDAVELQLRDRFPRSAKTMFGPVDRQARSLLTGVQRDASERVDLSKNRVLNRVKTGGDMIAGRYHLDVYVSYKNHLGQRLSLDIRQEKPLDKPAARVQLAQVGGHDAGSIYMREYALDEFEAAAADYLAQIGVVATSQRP